LELNANLYLLERLISQPFGKVNPLQKKELGE
jgi:hypothetical protein